MSTFLPTLINWLQQYGYPALWLSVFVAAIGVPLPVTLVLLAAGAFAALGDFNFVFLAGITITASVSGDSLGYLVGRQVGTKMLEWLEVERRFYLISPQAVSHSRLYFRKRGAWAIFLSRFLVSALGGAINLLAGAEIYPYPRFLFYDTSGQALGALIPLALGYAFGASWEAVGDILGTVSLFVLALLVAIYFMQRLFSTIRHTRVEKLKPDRTKEEVKRS